MDEKVYDYMDWPRIEAIVYGEETAPRDVMGLAERKPMSARKRMRQDILQYCFLYARCRNTDFL